MRITTNELGFLIGDFLLPYYGLMIGVGALVAVAIGYFLVNRHGKNKDIFIILVTSGILGGFAGAKILYIITDWKNVLVSDFSEVMQSGFVFYGGILGALLVLWLIHHLTRIDVLSYVQICISCVPIAHGFGRIGCHLVGCCYGVDYNGGLFPVQLTEAVLLFVLGIGLIIYVWKRERPKHTLSIYLGTYSVLRFCLEFLRGDDAERKIYGVFSTSQWISLAVLSGIIICSIWKHNKKQSAL